MTGKIEKIADGLFDLESPVFNARNLATAICMMASGDEMRGEAGNALATVANSLVEILDEITATRTEIFSLALAERGHAPKATAKDRHSVLRIVDAIQPGDGGAA
jgi:hypothetical protein